MKKIVFILIGSIIFLTGCKNTKNYYKKTTTTASKINIETGKKEIIYQIEEIEKI